MSITPYQGYIDFRFGPGATRFALAPGFRIPRRWRSDSWMVNPVQQNS